MKAAFGARERPYDAAMPGLRPIEASNGAV